MDQDKPVGDRVTLRSAVQFDKLKVGEFIEVANVDRKLRVRISVMIKDFVKKNNTEYVPRKFVTRMLEGNKLRIYCVSPDDPAYGGPTRFGVMGKWDYSGIATTAPQTGSPAAIDKPVVPYPVPVGPLPPIAAGVPATVFKNLAVGEHAAPCPASIFTFEQLEEACAHWGAVHGRVYAVVSANDVSDVWRVS